MKLLTAILMVLFVYDLFLIALEYTGKAIEINADKYHKVIIENTSLENHVHELQQYVRYLEYKSDSLYAVHYMDSIACMLNKQANKEYEYEW